MIFSRCSLGSVESLPICRRQGYDQLLVVCHPKHSAFYRRYLGFDMIGSVAECPHVQNKPAVPLSLDFAYVDRHQPVCYRRFFGDWLPDEQLRPSRMGPIEINVLRQLVDRTFQRTTKPVVWSPETPADNELEASRRVGGRLKGNGGRWEICGRTSNIQHRRGEAAGPGDVIEMVAAGAICGRTSNIQHRTSNIEGGGGGTVRRD